MKRKWYQFETVIKVESNCDTCYKGKFRDEFYQLCCKAHADKTPVFAGVINLPDGTTQEVFIVLGNQNIGLVGEGGIDSGEILK